MDIPAPIRKELTAMEQGIHDADGEGPIVMQWYRMILKSATTIPANENLQSPGGR